MDTVVGAWCEGETEREVTPEYTVVTTDTVVSEAPRDEYSGISLQRLTVFEIAYSRSVM